MNKFCFVLFQEILAEENEQRNFMFPDCESDTDDGWSEDGSGDIKQDSGI